MAYTTIVAAPASDPAGFKYLAPYTGSAIGQHWMYQGQHVLIIFDDLSKQAEAYRAVSLLLRRPPGREAYPGDVFYLHSRLLERCAKLSDELGGGSMTGLPIIETKANDVSAYIPTNVISITDGQMLPRVRPVQLGRPPGHQRRHLGLPRRWLGPGQGDAQVAGRLRLDLAQFRELEAFSAFGSDLDAASKAQLDPRRAPRRAAQAAAVPAFPMEEEVVSVWAGTTGQLDDVPLEDIRRFEREFLDYLKRDHKGLLESIRSTASLSDDSVRLLESSIATFKPQFTTSAGTPLVVNEAAVEALDEAEVQQATITRVKG